MLPCGSELRKCCMEEKARSEGSPLSAPQGHTEFFSYEITRYASGGGEAPVRARNQAQQGGPSGGSVLRACLRSCGAGSTPSCAGLCDALHSASPSAVSERLPSSGTRSLLPPPPARPLKLSLGSGSRSPEYRGCRRATAKSSPSWRTGLCLRGCCLPSPRPRPIASSCSLWGLMEAGLRLEGRQPPVQHAFWVPRNPGAGVAWPSLLWGRRSAGEIFSRWRENRCLFRCKFTKRVVRDGFFSSLAELTEKLPGLPRKRLFFSVGFLCGVPSFWSGLTKGALVPAETEKARRFFLPQKTGT